MQPRDRPAQSGVEVEGLRDRAALSIRCFRPASITEGHSTGADAWAAFASLPKRYQTNTCPPLSLLCYVWEITSSPTWA